MKGARLVILAAALLACIGAMAPAAAPSRAHIVPGEYSISMAGHHQAALGGTVEIVLSVEHSGPAAACTGGPGIFGCYQASQFMTYFDSAIIATSTAAITKDPSAPSACTAKVIQSVGGTLRRYIGGCLDLAGAWLSYSGPVWHVPFTCVSPGAQTLTFVLIEDSHLRTFVNDAQDHQPAHVHDGLTITCVDLPASGDDDGDSCTNGAELGPNPGIGGDRDPLEPWDFYDVTEDAYIDLTDTLLILSHFGHGHDDDPLDTTLDRYSPDMLKPWRTAPSTDGVDIIDALASLKSFGHGCMMG